jgi:hypothetical protein
MRKILLFTCGLFLSIITTSKAQLSGVFTVPGTYTSIAAAINDLNTLGINGPVTINVAAGYTETAPVGGYTLTATGTLANPIVFQKSGIGSNPLISSYIGGAGLPSTAVQDGVWRFIGSDYITIDGINIIDVNTSNPANMEFGYGFFKLSATDGCQNNTIKNCVVTLNRDNNGAGVGTAVDGSRGIEFVNALTGAHTTAITTIASSGSNSNNKIYKNTIQNCNIGIAIIGFADVSPFTNADTGNDIGGSSSLTGNTIINFGGGAASINPAAGLRTLAQYNFNASYNVLNNNNGSGVNHSAIIRGIYINTATSANTTINNNTLTINGGTTTAQVSIIENVAGATAANNTVSISNNLISNCTNVLTTTGAWYGIYNNGASSANLNVNNNTFSNNTTNATSGTTYLIYNTGSVASAININNNNLSFSHVGAVAYSGILYNIYNGGSTLLTNLSVSNNIFSGYNHNLTSTGTIYFIYNTVSNAGLTFNGNSWNNLSFNHGGSQYYMYNSSSTQVQVTVVGNNITNITRNSAAAGSMYGYYCGSSALPTSTQTFSNNLISNITATTSGTGTFYGFYNSDGATSPYPRKTVTTNTISNINYNCTGSFYGLMTNYLGDGSGASGSLIFNNAINNITTSGSMYGLYCGTIASPNYAFNAYTNTVSALTSNGAASTIYGSYLGGSASYNYYKNKIYDLTQNGATGVLYGLYITTSGNGNIYNNLIGSISTPSSTGASRLNGIYVAAGTTVNLTFNSVYMNSTSTGLNFGSNALYASTTPNLYLRNNIFVNNCTPTGTEFAVAYRRSSTTLTTYSTTSNNNLFYAGTPSANNLIYHDGTTAQQSLGAFKTLVTPRDAVSVTENPTFVSTTGSNANYLNINTTVPTQIESGGAAVAGVTSDYIGTVRNVTTPDIGAWEGSYISSGDALPPSFLASGYTSPACNLTSRTYTMNMTDISGVASGSLTPRVYFKVNSGPYTSTQGVLSSGTATNGVWTFSMSYAGTLGDVISYYITAQDIAMVPNLSASPNTGFTGVDVNNVTTPPTTPNTYTLVGTLAGTYSVGATGTFTSLTQASNAYNNSCLSGPVTFVLIDPSYSVNETFPIVFNNNPYASATNSLLIVPAAAMNVSISGTTSATSTLKFLNSKYITIDGLNTGGSSIAVTNPNTVSSAVIWLASTSAVGPGNTNIGIKHLTITGGLTTSGYGIIAGVDGVSPSTTAGIDIDNITVQGNTILGANYGIYATGTATTAAGLDNWNITNNAIGPVVSSTANIGYQGIYLGNMNIAAVNNNTISNVQGTNAYEWGINLTAGVRNATVNLNTINSIRYTGASGYSGLGIDVNVNNTSANIIIQNNMISDLTGDGWSSFTAGGTAGIRVASSASVGGINIQNNSIAINQGTTIAGSSQANVSAAIYFGANASNVDLRNNILYSDVQYSTNLASKTYAIYSAAPSTAFTSIDFNDYYTAGSQASLSFIAAASQTNMAMLTSSFGQNVNSQNILPSFTGLTDLHLVPATNAQLDNTGTPIVGITIDIDNQVRNVTTPDMGADEYTSPTCTTASSGTLVTNSYSVCNGQGITLTTNTVSTGAGTVYQWLSSTSASGPFTNVIGGSGANTPAYITNTLTTGNLFYQLQTTCTSLSLTSVSNMATVAINPVPTATVAPMAPICAGQNLTFTSTTNIGNIFTWTGPNSFTSNVQNPVIASATSSANGVYTLVVSALNCSATAQTTSVTVNYTQLGINANPNFVCTSGTSTMTVTGNAITYTWSTGSSSPSIVQTITATTVYSVVGTGTSNCQATAIQTITVINPTISAIGAVVCNTTAVGTLSASSFGPISWYSSPTSTVVLGTGNTFTATAPTTTTYYAQANATSASTLFTTLVGGNGSTGNMFDVVAQNNIIVNGFDVHLNGTATTTIEVWTRAGSFVGFNTSNAGWTNVLTTTVVGLGTGVLTPVSGTFAVPVNAGQTQAFFVTPNGGSGFNYTNGGPVGSIYASNSDAQVLVGNAGGYFSSTIASRVFNGKMNYSIPGCQSPIIPVTLTVSSQPTITLGASQSSVCPGTSVNIGATGATTYTWSTGANGALIAVTPTASTIYSISGENTPGCVGTASIAITTNSVAPLNVTASSSVICVGKTATLTANGALTYVWNTTATTTVISVTPSVSTTYTVTGTAANTCTNAATISVNTNSLPVVGITSSASLICVGQPANLTASGATTYTWNTAATTTVISVTPSVNTTYTVTGTAANTCSNSVVYTQSVSTCTGIDVNANSSFSNIIRVYPNPSNGVITAEFGFDGEKEILITNSVGQLIKSIKTKNYSEVINLDQYSKGIYYVKIMSNNNASNHRIILD